MLRMRRRLSDVDTDADSDGPGPCSMLRIRGTRNGTRPLARGLPHWRFGRFGLASTMRIDGAWELAPNAQKYYGR